MTFKKILPWLAGGIVVTLAGAAVVLNRFWIFGRQTRLGELAEEGARRGMEGARGGAGLAMGWGGGPMGGFGVLGGLRMFIGPLFIALLFLFTVWAFLKIVRASSARTQAVVQTGGRGCPSCGRPTAADWNHCPYCGTNLDQAGASPADPIA